MTDFGLWGGIVPGNGADIAALADAGVIGFKAFMCNSGLPEFPRADDLTLFEGMQTAAQSMTCRWLSMRKAKRSPLASPAESAPQDGSDVRA